MLDATFFRRVGPNVRERYRNHIFDDAKDVNDRKFKGYSTYGSKWVTMNVKKSFKQSAPKGGYSYSQAKKGRMFPVQDDTYSNTNAPVLTGSLYKDFSVVRTSPNGFQLGWITYGARVQSLANKKRFLSTDQQPLPKGVINYMMKQAEPYTDKKLKRIMPKSKTIRIGKK